MNFLVPAAETHTGPERLRVALIGYHPDIMSGKTNEEEEEEEEEHYPVPQPQKLVLEYVTLAPVSQSRVKSTGASRAK